MAEFVLLVVGILAQLVDIAEEAEAEPVAG